MANRVVMDSSGLRISKPGVDVLSASSEDLIMDSQDKMLQVIDSGFFTNIPSNATRQITLPSLNFIPFVLVYSPNKNCRTTFSGNTATFFPETAGVWDLYWAVLNVPRG